MVKCTAKWEDIKQLSSTSKKGVSCPLYTTLVQLVPA